MAGFGRSLDRRAIEAALGLGTVAAARPRLILEDLRERLIAYLPLVGLLMVLLSLLLLFQTSTIANASFALRTLENQRDTLVQRNLQLEAEIAANQSLRTVEFYATNRLGMVPATQRRYIAVPISSQGSEIPQDRPPSWNPEVTSRPRDDSAWGQIQSILGALFGGSP